MSNLNNFETLKNLIKGLIKPQTESEIATQQYLMNQFKEAYYSSLKSLEKLRPVVPSYGSDKAGKIREGYITVKNQYYQMMTEV